MVAGALVTQRLVDQDKESLIWQFCRNPPSRCDAEQQAAPGGKHLLRDQNGEGGTHGTANDAHALPGQVESQHLGMVAGPAWKRLAASIGPQRSNDVAIRIEDA